MDNEIEKQREKLNDALKTAEIAVDALKSALTVLDDTYETKPCLRCMHLKCVLLCKWNRREFADLFQSKDEEQNEEKLSRLDDEW